VSHRRRHRFEPGGERLVRSGAERAYELMRLSRAEYPIRVMARVLGVSASGFYDWRDRQLSDRQRSNTALLRRIRTIHAVSHGTYGAPRVHAELRAEGVQVGRKRVARLMREAGIAGVSRRRRTVSTTVRAPERQSAGDLVKRDFTADGPNRECPLFCV
jgi:putative transposase